MTSTDPVWAEVPLERAAVRLDSDLTCDVCIVGAGIAGLTIAYRLVKMGKAVVVLEGKSKIASGESFATTAHLASYIDDGFDHVRSVRGADAVRAAHASHAAAIDFIEATAKAERIECDFLRVPGYLFPGADGGTTSIDREEKLAREHGIAVERLAQVPFERSGGSPCLRFPDQGQFHPLKYLTGLAGAIHDLGGAIHTDEQVESVKGGRSAVIATQRGRTIRADAVVIATNTPINSGVRTNMRLAPYTTYVIAGKIPPGSVEAGLYWDTEDPYHYVRTQRTESGSEWLIVGGEDHKTGQADDRVERWSRLEAWARKRFPALGRIDHRWDGQVIETLDGLGLIGPEPGGEANVFIASGDSGMGMTHGTLAGLILPDLIAGRTNPWAELYSPSRLPIAAIKTLVTENANMAAQYADYATSGDISSAEELAPGTGAVVRRGLAKVAVYRTKEGATCEMSAVCPHMGGIVHWNASDERWECPLHGSTFSAQGEVLHGPATKGLSPIAAASE